MGGGPCSHKIARTHCRPRAEQVTTHFLRAIFEHLHLAVRQQAADRAAAERQQEQAAAEQYQRYQKALEEQGPYAEQGYYTQPAPGQAPPHTPATQPTQPWRSPADAARQARDRQIAMKFV